MGKVLENGRLSEIISELKKTEKKIVLTNGCFDLLHIGHARYLKEARELGDCLFVGLNSDASVKQLKGSERPLNKQEDRAELLSYLSFVDYVIIFPELTADELLRKIKPDIYVKGGDYTKESLPEYKTISEINSEVAFINFVEGYSTTKIISAARIKC